MSAISPATTRDAARPVSRSRTQTPPSHPAPISLASVVRSERLKLRTLRAPKVLAAVIVAAFWGFGALTAFIAGDSLAKSGGTADVAANVASLPGAGLGLGAILFGVLGALSVTNEYSTGAIALSLQTVPRRRLLVTAKTLVLCGWATGIAVVGALGSLAVGHLMLAAHDYSVPVTDPLLLRNAGCAVLAANGLTLLGMALGILTRSTVGAVMSVVLLFTLLPAVVQLLPPGAARMGEAAPSGLLTTALATLAHSPAEVWGAGLALLVWGVVPTLLAAVVFERRAVVR